MIEACIDAENCGDEESDCILKQKSIRDALSRFDAGKMMNYKQGQIVFETGKKIIGFYVMCEGVVKEFYRKNGETITLRVFKRGDLLTGDAFFREKDWHKTTAKAIYSSRIVFLPREVFPGLMRAAGSTVGKKLAENMKRLRRRLSLVSCSVLENIVFWLIRLLPEFNNTLSISNKELARIAGCSPVTMSRKLGKLAGDGLIKKNGQEIFVPEKEQLQEIIPSVELV